MHSVVGGGCTNLSGPMTTRITPTSSRSLILTPTAMGPVAASIAMWLSPESLTDRSWPMVRTGRSGWGGRRCNRCVNVLHNVLSYQVEKIVALDNIHASDERGCVAKIDFWKAQFCQDSRTKLKEVRKCAKPPNVCSDTQFTCSKIGPRTLMRISSVASCTIVRLLWKERREREISLTKNKNQANKHSKQTYRKQKPKAKTQHTRRYSKSIGHLKLKELPGFVSIERFQKIQTQNENLCIRPELDDHVVKPGTLFSVGKRDPVWERCHELREIDGFCDLKEWILFHRYTPVW